MALRSMAIGDECPYDIVSRSMETCPRFTPRLAFDGLGGTIATCAHVRASIARPALGESGLGSFYMQCALRTGDVEAERDFAVPLD